MFKGVKVLINHDRCPECGHNIKGNYWNCRKCGNQDLTNWPLTLILWATYILIIGVVILFMIDNFCKAERLIPFMNSYSMMC